MQKIVYIINSLRKAGPVNVLYEIVSHLDRSRYRIYILKLLEDDPSRSITPEFKQLGVEIISLSSTLLKLEFRTRMVARQVDSIMREIQPDVVHTHGYHPVLVASYLKEWKRLETLHCICQEDFVLSKGRMIGTYMIRRYLHALRKMDHFAAISGAVKAAYQSVLGGDRITVVYNGCDTERFYPVSPGQASALKAKLDIPTESKVYTVVGTLSKGKDPQTIVQAFIELYRQDRLDKNTLVLFLGKGKLLDKCMKMASDYPFIQFKGYRMNVVEYMQIADYSICASRSEGFGLNYVESLMVDVPVIGSDIPPFREFTGLMPALRSLQFKAGDKEGLKRAIIRSQRIHLDRKQLGNVARETFSAKRMAEKYSFLYGSFSCQASSF